MAYTPTTWAAGDTLTAAGLNKMEQGIAAASSGGSLVVNVTQTWNNNTFTLVANKTAGELWSAMKSGMSIVARFFDSSADHMTDEPFAVAAQYYMHYDASESPTYTIELGNFFLSADAASDYPSYDSSDEPTVV